MISSPFGKLFKREERGKKNREKGRKREKKEKGKKKREKHIGLEKREMVSKKGRFWEFIILYYLL